MSHPLPPLHRVIVSVGSNADEERMVAEAARRLSLLLEGALCSPRLRTQPVGKPLEAEEWPAPTFLNMVVAGGTRLPADELERWLKDTERALGRREDEKRRGKVSIDLDLLAYDQRRFHPGDWQRQHVRRLLTYVSP